jgi:hypothetical protein
MLPLCRLSPCAPPCWPARSPASTWPNAWLVSAARSRCAGRCRGLDHWAARRPVAPSRIGPPRCCRPRPRRPQIQPALRLDPRGGADLRRRPWCPYQSAAREGLRLDRLRPLHPRDPPRRAGTGRPLVVGRRKQERVRPAHQVGSGALSASTALLPDLVNRFHETNQIGWRNSDPTDLIRRSAPLGARLEGWPLARPRFRLFPISTPLVAKVRQV